MAPARVVRAAHPGDVAVAAELRPGIASIQAELGVDPEFPAHVTSAAERAADAPRLPELDRTDIEFLTLDPPGSQDLDQALHIERSAHGYRVHYAIADLAAFISPGDAVDLEARRRGQTLYGADSKIPLHPPVISEGAASLLPDQVRPALLWTIDLDETGEGTEATVERALVRSRRQLDYAQAQQQIDAGTGEATLMLLAQIGPLRMAREAARGGVSLPRTEQQIDASGPHWRLEFRSLLPVELWNAQVSLLTGMAAASLMVYARVGLLRTLPPADSRDVRRLRRTAKALGVEWPAETTYPQFVRALDQSNPAHAAVLVACTRLFRGAGYVAFDGELPAQPEHSAVAAEYAHVTAPLRRLVDRYTSEICLALCAGNPVPRWVLDTLEELPDTMQESRRRAGRYESAILNLVEAEVLKEQVGERFRAVVVELDDRDPRRGEVTVVQPAIEAKIASSRELPLGTEVDAVLTQADPATRSVRFELR